MTGGSVHSIQTLGTLDGPGVRFVLFLQGCNLRCGFCHNPDTHSSVGGHIYTAKEIVDKVTRYKEYFGEEGGITVSGGEPLLQSEFVLEIFRLCKEIGVNTCLDTSGSIMNDKVRSLLSYTDRVLLDIKFTSDELYLKYIGCSASMPLKFLKILNERNIKTTLRQVIVPTLNDTRENILALKEIKNSHPCVDKIELLPFKKICQTKYDSLGIAFPFKDFPTPTHAKMEELNALL